MINPLALIVEDDPSLAMIFARALEDAKFETEIFREGAKALNRLSEASPAVVVLDLHLPQISGQDVLKQIRASEHLSNTKVILATADPILAETLRQEADLVLIKPISFIQLRDLASRLRPSDLI